MTDGTAHGERTAFGAFLREVRNELAASSAPGVPSKSRVPADWRRLGKETTPFQGESLRGLVARACQRNTLPNSWGVLQHLGLVHRNRVLVSEDPRIEPAELAYALGVAEHDVRSRRYDATTAGRMSFHGLDLNSGRIETRVRRFSPVALSDPEQRFHRAVWELKDIPFCLVGWDILQERCFCEGDGIVQGWTRTLNRIEECDKCGDPLHSLEPHPVPPDMIPALSILGAIVDPRPEARAAAASHLPEALRQSERSLLFRTIILLARALDPYADGEPIEEPARRLDAMHRACESIRQWPSGLDGLDWHESTTANAIATLRAQWPKLGRAVERKGEEKRPLRKPPAGTKPRTEEGMASKPGVVGIRPAYELACLTSEVMLAAWEQGLVTKHWKRHGERSLPAFDVAEVEAFASAWHDRIEPRALAYRLGIPYYGVEQLVALGVLVADGPALAGTGPNFRTKTISDFLARIEGKRRPELTDLATLRMVMESIGGRMKPWGPVLQLLVEGGLAFDLAHGTPFINRIRVERVDVDRILALTFEPPQDCGLSFRDTMVKGDALEVLNAGVGGKRLLAGLPSLGRNPQTFAVADVEMRARMLMTVPELAARLGLDCSTAYHRARRSGATEVMPGGWDRVFLSNLADFLRHTRGQARRLEQPDVKERRM